MLHAYTGKIKIDTIALYDKEFEAFWLANFGLSILQSHRLSKYAQFFIIIFSVICDIILAYKLILSSKRMGFVANFAQGALKEQLPLSMWGLSSQGVEQFGRSAALVSGLYSDLSFLDHVHEFYTS